MRIPPSGCSLQFIGAGDGNGGIMFSANFNHSWRAAPMSVIAYPHTPATHSALRLHGALIKLCGCRVERNGHAGIRL